MRRQKKGHNLDDELTDVGRPRHQEDFQMSKVAQIVGIDESDNLRARGKQETEGNNYIEFEFATRSIHHEYYRFLGESYVHGIMNGEAIVLQNRDELPTCPFELR
jgi:hypothetical protein